MEGIQKLRTENKQVEVKTLEQLTSYQVQFKQRIDMEEVMNIYHFIVDSSYDLYLYQDHLIADASNLPKLLSFFFYYDTDRPFVMILDGKDVTYAYNKIMSICEEPIENCVVRRFHEANRDQAILV